jgi:FlaA1/EpsC-like NDP-sugar epimerase
VTGAGGSIGSEIVQQVLGFGPRCVVALDSDETHLHDARVEWGKHDSELILELADVRDRVRIDRCFDEYRPDVVFHAAAHKHVPILEEFPEEAVKTNVLGTRSVLEATARYDVERFIFVSTDKAVDPSSIMGASKRVAEMMVQAAAHAGRDGTAYACVRFGNVLGSRGSVVPTFMRQIEQGGPVTVSDPEMERFFMTNDEAVQLVLHTATLTHEGEVFVLDMGEPVRIMALAHHLIRLAGLVPNRDIEIVVTGPRRGEKLIEVLSTDPLRPSDHPKISIADASTPSAATLHDAVAMLEELADNGDRESLRDLLHGLARRKWDADEMIDLRAPVGATDWVDELGSEAG